MAFDIPKLKYAEDALAPAISKETVSFHYGKHTKKYFDTMNELIKGTIYEKRTDLDTLINKDTMLHMESKLFHNACQAWNHAFMWAGLTPADQSGEPSETLMSEINNSFGSFDSFKRKFTDTAVKQFASGWCWLIWKDNQLLVKSTPNATSPLTDKGQIPLLTCDLWEHAYLYDPKYAADRPSYIKAWWSVVDWAVVSENYAAAVKK